MAKQNSEALLKLALEHLGNLRPYKQDQAAHDALQQVLLSLQRAQLELALEYRSLAQREVAKARSECDANAALRVRELCCAFSGDVILVARGDAYVAASADHLSRASPHLKAMIQGIPPESSKKREIPVLSALFPDRRVPVSSLTLILTALAAKAAGSDLLPAADLYAIAEAVSLCEQWELPDVRQRIHDGLRAGRIALGMTSSDAVDTLRAAREQAMRCKGSVGKQTSHVNMHQLWDAIARLAFESLSSVVSSARCAAVLDNLDIATITDLLDQDFRPHELRLSGFPKESNSDLMNGVYVKLPALCDGHPAWKRESTRRGVLFIYRNRGKWKISGQLGGQISYALLRSESIPSSLGIQGPFWETFANASWQEQPMVKMEGSTSTACAPVQKQGGNLCPSGTASLNSAGDDPVHWSSDTCRLAWEWLARKVEYAVGTPLAALRALAELGHGHSSLEERLLRHAAESNVLGQHEELQLLSTELVQRLLSQDALHTSTADELEVLRTVLAFSERRPTSLECLLTSVRLPFVRIPRLREELAAEDYKRLQECTSWSAMFEEAMAVQLGKRPLREDDENPRLRKRARFADIPQLSAAEVVSLCNMGGS
jgi:hypothetical protein